MREIFIYNTVSGRGISNKKLDKIIDYLTSLYPEITLCKTAKKGDAKNYTLQYIKDTYLIFVLGGDGTIHDIVSAIVESNYSPTICVIPNGTMNDLAHTLSIPRDYRKAIDLSLTTSPKYFSIMRVNNEYAIYASAIGRFSSTSYDTPQNAKKIYGKLSYFCHAIKDLWHYPPIYANLVVDGKPITTKFSLLLTCIGSYVAGFPIGKKNNFDTTAKLIIINEKLNKQQGSISSIYSIAKLFLFGISNADKDHLTTVLDFTNLKIELNKPHPIVLDGEKYLDSTYDIKILPRQIRFISNK